MLILADKILKDEKYKQNYEKLSKTSPSDQSLCIVEDISGISASHY